jgi:hypothetical protein
VSVLLALLAVATLLATTLFRGRESEDMGGEGAR